MNYLEGEWIAWFDAPLRFKIFHMFYVFLEPYFFFKPRVVVLPPPRRWDLEKFEEICGRYGKYEGICGKYEGL